MRLYYLIFSIFMLAGISVAHLTLPDSVYHVAYPMLKVDIEEVYKQVDVNQLPTRILIVNHHLLAPDLIAQALAGIATKDKKTVVLISPNHFGVGNGFAITTSFLWRTPYGELVADKNVIKQLVQNGVTLNSIPFEREHGIFNIIPFIKRSLPNARIVPIMIRDMVSPNDIDALAKILPPDAVIIGSFDFSHEVTSSVADTQDAQSIRVLETFDISLVSRLALDSRPGLRLLMQYALLYNKRRFVLLGSSNSSKILNQPNQTNVTSYVTGYFTY